MSRASRVSSAVVSWTSRVSRRPPERATIAATSRNTRTSEPRRSRLASVTRMSAMRSRRTCRLGLETIAESAHRFYQTAGGAELGAEPLHMHVDGACLNVGRGLPHRLEEMAARLHAAAPLREHQEQPVLSRCEVDRSAVDEHAMFAAIDVYRSNREHVGSDGRPRSHSPQNRTDAQHEFLRTEWFREIVVRAEGKATHTIRFFHARGEHEDADTQRRLRRAQLLENLVPRDVGKHQIEDDEHRLLASSSVEGVGTRRGRGDTIASLGEVIHDEGDDVRFVVNNQDALASWSRRVGYSCHARAPSAACAGWSARVAASRRSIFATIISMATGL